MGKTVDAKVWVYPEGANDAFIDIITTDSAGADTTESSTTACPAGVFTLIKIEDYAVPDDVVRVRIKLRVLTTGQYAYFMPPRVTGRNVYEYLLPDDFDNGDVIDVQLQTSGYSDDACDDLLPTRFEPVWGYDFTNDGTYKYLRLPALYGANRQIRLIGTTPLEVLSDDTDTISTDNDKELDLIIAYAAYWLYRAQKGIPASEDVSRLTGEAGYWFYEYQRLLPSSKMVSPQGRMNIKSLLR